MSRLVTWHVHGPRIDEDGIRAMMRAYRSAGGTVTPTTADAFGGAPDALHYLAGQAAQSLDPAATRAARAFAVAEVRTLLAELCPPPVLRRVADLCRRHG